MKNVYVSFVDIHKLNNGAATSSHSYVAEGIIPFFCCFFILLLNSVLYYVTFDVTCCNNVCYDKFRCYN